VQIFEPVIEPLQKVTIEPMMPYIGCFFFKFHLIVGVEESIMNTLYRLRITDQLFKILRFIRVVRSQSTLQRLLGGECVNAQQGPRGDII
jgi:hypothetical protein